VAHKEPIDVTSQQTLSIDDTGIHVCMLKGACEAETAQDNEKQWQIEIHRPDVPIQLIIAVINDEIFLRMQQTGRIHTRVFAATQQ